MDVKKNKLVSAAITGVMAGAIISGGLFAGCMTGGHDQKGECHGVNACKGSGACGGKGHSCAGKNACKGKGWVKKTKKECEAKGGTWKK